MLLIPNVRLIFWTVIWKEHLVELLPQQNCSYVHFNSSWLTSHQQSQKPWILTSQHIDNPYPSYPYLEHFLRTYQFTKYHNLRCLRRQLSFKLMAFRTIYLPWISPNTNNQTKPLNGLGTSGLAKELNCKLGFASNHSRWNPGCREPSEARSSRPSPQIWRTPGKSSFAVQNLPFFFLLGCQLHVRNKLSKI